MVKLSCPLLPRDCQIEIINMLSPAPLSSSFIQKRSKGKVQEKGFIVKLLPEAKKVKTWPKKYPKSIEKELYELRQSFGITFNYSNLDLSNIDQDCLFYFISAFGSEEDYEKFICSSTFNSKKTPQEYHQEAIFLALKYGNIELILYFQKFMNIYQNDLTKGLCSTMFRSAAEFGYVNILQTLLVQDFQFDPAAENNYATREAASCGHLDVVKYLMEEVNEKYRIDPAAQDNHAIREAAWEGNLAVVKYLMEEVDNEKYGINPAAEDNEAIQNAAAHGQLDVVKYLMEEVDEKYEVSPAAGDNQAIQWAALFGHLAVVKYLMEEVDEKCGIDPAALNNQAIRNAAERGHLDILKYLMEQVDEKYGIDPAAQDNYAIRYAASNGKMDVVKYFVSLDSKFRIDLSIGR